MLARNPNAGSQDEIRIHSVLQAVRKLATDLDREQPYLSGLLQRFDEEMSEAVSFFIKLNPRFKPPSISKDASLNVRGGVAAHSLAMGIATRAMGSRGKFMVGSKEVF